MSDLLDLLMDMEIALSSPWAEAARKAHDEIARLRAEVERLRAVVEAARPICLRWETRGLGPNLPGEKPTDAELLNVLCEKVRVLDGEPPQPKGYGMEEYTRDMNPEPCQTCGGTGSLPTIEKNLVTREMALDAGDPSYEGSVAYYSRGEVPCPMCGGSGDVRSCDPYGTEPDWVKCPTCGGDGYSPTDGCPHSVCASNCGGSGRKR